MKRQRKEEGYLVEFSKNRVHYIIDVMIEYSRRLQAGERLDPIEVIEIPDRGRFIIDGHHRYVASHQSGITSTYKSNSRIRSDRNA